MQFMSNVSYTVLCQIGNQIGQAHTNEVYLRTNKTLCASDRPETTLCCAATLA